MRRLRILTTKYELGFTLDGSSGILLSDIDGLGESLEYENVQNDRAFSLSTMRRHVFSEIEMTLNFGVVRSASSDCIARPYTTYRSFCEFLHRHLRNGLILEYYNGEGDIRYAQIYLSQQPKSQRKQDVAGVLQERFVFSRMSQWYTTERGVLHGSLLGSLEKEPQRYLVINDGDEDIRCSFELHDIWDKNVHVLMTKYDPEWEKEHGRIAYNWAATIEGAVHICIEESAIMPNANVATFDCDRSTVTAHEEFYYRFVPSLPATRRSENKSLYALLSRSAYSMQNSGAFITVPSGSWQILLKDDTPSVFTLTSHGTSDWSLSEPNRYHYMNTSGEWTGAPGTPSYSSIEPISLTARHAYAVIVLMDTSAPASKMSLVGPSSSLVYTSGFSSLSVTSDTRKCVGMVISSVSSDITIYPLIQHISLASPDSSYSGPFSRVFVFDLSGSIEDWTGDSMAQKAKICDAEALVTRYASYLVSESIGAPRMEMLLKRGYMD